MKKSALVGIGLLLAVASVQAEPLAFHCTAIPTADRHVWKYTFEADTTLSTGVIRGVSYGGRPYTDAIETGFTPTRMVIKTMQPRVSQGWIDRVTLDFEFGGAQGVCVMVRANGEKKF
jgi:hypothetical protein